MKPGVAYSCNCFPKDRLFHKILVFLLMGFCTGCCNLQAAVDRPKLHCFQVHSNLT